MKRPSIKDVLFYGSVFVIKFILVLGFIVVIAIMVNQA